MKITAHTIVKNSQRWIWFVLNSVLDYVDDILVWDTGSTDDTVKIISSIKNPKIKFRREPIHDEYDFTKVRQMMLKNTKSDWLLVIDSDEIWTREAITELTATIRRHGEEYDFLITRFYNLLGDVYHYQEEEGGMYHVGPYSGHVTIRAIHMQRIPGLHFSRPHGQQGLFDSNEVAIQDRVNAKSLLLNGRYLHTTHLVRSIDSKHDRDTIKRAFKYKYELGIPFPKNFRYPEVFYLPRPKLVPSPWEKRSFLYVLNAAWQTPLKKLKRRLITPPSGY